MASKKNEFLRFCMKLKQLFDMFCLCYLVLKYFALVAEPFLGYADHATEGRCIAQMSAVFQAIERDAGRLNDGINRKK